MEPAETVAALYEAVLGRAPDAGGLEYYTNAINNGASAADVRASLAYSPEAQNLIENIYKADLNRAADAGGKQFFTERLATGGLLSDVKASVQDSPEARGLLGGTKPPVVQPPTTTLTAAQLAAQQAAQIAAQQAAAQQAAQIAAQQAAAQQAALLAAQQVSAEQAALNATKFTPQLNALYQKVFGRNADASGLAYYSNLLAQGTPISTIEETMRGSSEFQSPTVQTFQKGVRTVPFGSQLMEGQVKQMAQYAQPAAQAGTGMGSPSLQGFLGSNPAASTLSPFQQQMQYQAALPSMIQPFNPADIPATYQQQLTPTPRLDISSTAIPSWLQTAINAQRTKDGITLTEQDKFIAANPTVTNSGLGPVVPRVVTPPVVTPPIVTPPVVTPPIVTTPGVTTPVIKPTVTPSTTVGLLAATQISPDILNAYVNNLGRTADLPGASYWQTRANQGLSMADVIANIAGSPEGLLYAPIRADKLAAANAPYIAPPE